jgi:acetyl esterase
MPIDPQLKPMLDAANAPGNPGMETLDVASAREVALQMVAATGAARTEVASVENRTIPGPLGEIPVRIYTPEGEGPKGVLVFFHGSGFVIYNLDSHDAECRALAQRAGIIVVSVDYRLAPEHKFPAGPEDCYAATCWASDHAKELGGDPARMAVGGDSAGGCLAAVVCQMARNRNGPELQFQLLIYPVTDCRAGHPSMQENAEGYLLTRAQMLWFIDHYLRTPEDANDPLCSPLLANSFDALPPALVVTAEFDPLRDEGEAYAEKLRAAGVAVTLHRYDGMIHGFFQMSGLLDAARASMDEAVSALRGAIGSGHG